MATRIRMCSEDREKYGGPEWIEFDYAQLADMSVELIEEFETQADMTVTEFGMQLPRGSSKVLRAMLWFGRRAAGCTEQFGDLKPKIFQLEIENTGGDADPPAPTNRAGRRAVSRKGAARSTPTPGAESAT